MRDLPRAAAVAVVVSTLLCAPPRNATGAHGEAAVNLYVSPGGSDRWSGRRSAANPARTDGPLATLEAARDALRRRARRGPATVWVRGGVYPRDRAFELGPEDGVPSPGRVVYRAYRDEEPRLVGGRSVEGWGPVREAAVLDRLEPAARGRVLRADLRRQGITSFGRMTRRGFGIGTTAAGLELYFRRRPMTLARWPNDGWLRIAGAPAGQEGGRFTYEGDRPARWKQPADAWVHGYWTWDWADSYERVRHLDPEKREVETEPPHGVYGYTPGKRFYFLNVLEELDSPGEWYLDRSSGVLYFWPPEPMRRGEAVVSMLEAPLVEVRGAQGVTLRGLTLECGRAAGIRVRDGSRCRVEDCTVVCMGTDGVVVEGGTRNVVSGCELHALDETGIALSGGDRKTLTPGHQSAMGNHIHDYARWCRTYRPGVMLGGAGNRVANNLIHDAPHNAILMGGNDHVVELNEIHHVCLQTGDAGAVYMGRDMTMRGNLIRHNYFHDIARAIGGSNGFVDVMAVYLDDCFCGTTVYGNLFVRAGRAAMIGGGRDNTIANNVFVDCAPAVHVDSRGIGWAKFWFDGRDPFIMNGLKAMDAARPPYSARYPRLARLLQEEPGLATGNAVVRNLCVGGKWIELFDGLDERIVKVERNLVGGDPGFVNAAKGDYRLRADSPAWKLGFQPIPFERIGLQGRPGAGAADARQ